MQFPATTSGGLLLPVILALGSESNALSGLHEHLNSPTLTLMPTPIKNKNRAGEMAQWVEMPTTKADNLS